jgi:hypothetical protein
VPQTQRNRRIAGLRAVSQLSAVTGAVRAGALTARFRGEPAVQLIAAQDPGQRADDSWRAAARPQLGYPVPGDQRGGVGIAELELPPADRGVARAAVSGQHEQLDEVMGHGERDAERLLAQYGGGEVPAAI